jgi:Acyl CoA:acetate/3-ketoacid CoA transferase
VRKVIARRAALELHRGAIINLGYGMPDGVAAVLAEEGAQNEVTFTVEQGHVGGVPAGGSDFGMCVNPAATLDAGAQFDWYDGGGLDIAFLSFAQLDADGNVNVSRFGDRIPGVGGFINISQGARRLVFVGTFVAGRGRYSVGGDQPIVLPDDGIPKLVTNVEQISFAAARALETGQPVLYVTERAVFRLTPDGPELIEIAPGLDVERHILPYMRFKPRVSDDLTTMDERIFHDEPMRLTLAAGKGESA